METQAVVPNALGRIDEQKESNARVIKDHASGRCMGIQFSVRSNDAPLSGCDLAPGMYHLTLSTYQWHCISERTQHVDLQFKSCVSLSSRQGGVHGATHR
jgi:hypothetical protein